MPSLRRLRRLLAGTLAISLALGPTQPAFAQGRAALGRAPARVPSRAALTTLVSPSASLGAFSAAPTALAPGLGRSPAAESVPASASPAGTTAGEAAASRIAEPVAAVRAPARAFATVSGRGGESRADSAAPESRVTEGRSLFDGAAVRRARGFAAAAVLAGALALPFVAEARPSAEPGSRLAPAPISAQAPAAQSPAVPAAPAAQTPAKNPIQTTVELDRESFEPAEGALVTLNVANNGQDSVLLPAEETKLAIERGLGGRFTVTGGPAGDVLVPPGKSVKVPFELVVTRLPDGFERGDSVRVSFPGDTLSNGVEIPPFSVELKSGLEKGSKPALVDTPPFPAPWGFHARAALAWLAAAFSAWAGLRAWRRFRAWWDGPPDLPAIPDPVELAGRRIGALQADVAAGARPSDFYVSLAILLDFYFSATLQVDALAQVGRASSLAEAARTVRGLESLLKKLNDPSAQSLTLLRGRLERALYEEAPVSPEDMLADLDAVRVLVRARFASEKSPVIKLSPGVTATIEQDKLGKNGKRKRGPTVLTLRGKPHSPERDKWAKQIRVLAPGRAGGRKPRLRGTGEQYSSAVELRYPRVEGGFWVVHPTGRSYWPGWDPESRFDAAVKKAAETKPAPAAAPASPPAALFGAASIFTGVGVSSPLWLLGLVPVLGWALWRWKTRDAGAAYTAPAAWTGAPRSLRQRLGRFSEPFAALALALSIVALSGPTWGVDQPPPPPRSDRPTAVDSGKRSVDTEIVLDRSGSMYWGDKMRQAQDAAKTLIERNRETENRMALVLFHSNGRVVQNLTHDFDALTNAVDGISGEGGTDLAEGLDAAVEHFIEMNILDLAAQDVPGAEATRQKLKSHGLPAALEEAAKHQGLLKKIEASDRDRVIIFLTDGEGGDPTQAIERARLLNIKIYAVAVGYDANEHYLRIMAERTGGRLFKADDASKLTDIFLEIGGFKNKAPVAIIAPETARPTDRSREAAAAAFAALVMALLLQHSAAAPEGEPRRRRPGKAKQAAVNGALLLALAAPAAQPPAQNGQPPAQGAPEAKQAEELPWSPWDLLPYRPDRELRRANELLNEKKYDEAAQLYKRSREKSGTPEASLGEGMALRRGGKPVEAEAALKRARDLAAERARPDLVASARNQLGLSALERGDSQEALNQFRLAAQPPDDRKRETAEHRVAREAARRNYEELLRRQGGGGGQGGQQGQDKDKQGKGQGQQGGNKKPGDQDPKQGQGQGKPGDKPADGKPKPGEGKPQDGKPTDPSKEKSEAINELEKSMKEKDRGGLTGGPARRSPGRAWGILPALPALPAFLAEPFAAVGRWLEAGLAWLAGAPSGAKIIWMNPEYLVYLAVALAAVAYVGVRALRRLRRAETLLSTKAPPRPLKSRTFRRALGQRVAAWLAVAFLGLAAAGPAYTVSDHTVSFGGKAIVFGQDISKSVTWAEDGRFDQAVKGLERFSYWINNEHAGDRAVIIPFAAEAGEATLSTDHTNLTFQIHHFGQDGRYLEEGSNLLSIVDRAEKVFNAAKVPEDQRVLIIMSDGGDEAYGLEYAAERARAAGIRVHTLGLGPNASRMKVPEHLVKEVGSEYILDRWGSPAQTSLNEEPLKMIAEKTGGMYRQVSSERDVERVLYQIAHTEKVKSPGVAAKSAARGLLLPAAALGALALLLGRRAGRAPSAARADATGGRMEAVERAASGIKFEELLRGRFRSQDIVPSGVEQADTVEYTNQPRRAIDHRATARVNRLQAKRFEDEPEIPVWIVADLSPSGALASDGVSKRRVIEDAAGALAIAAAKSPDQHPVGLIAFSDRPELMLPPRRGLGKARDLYRRLTLVEPEGRGTDVSDALGRALQRLPRRGVIVLVSDFQSKDIETRLAAAGGRHVLIPVVVRDRIETQDPAGVGPVAVVDPETGRQAEIDLDSPAVRARLVEERAARAAALQSALSAGKSRSVDLTAQDGFLDQLVRQLQNAGGKR